MPADAPPLPVSTETHGAFQLLGGGLAGDTGAGALPPELS